MLLLEIAFGNLGKQKRCRRDFEYFSIEAVLAHNVLVTHRVGGAACDCFIEWLECCAGEWTVSLEKQLRNSRLNDSEPYKVHDEELQARPCSTPRSG